MASLISRKLSLGRFLSARIFQADTSPPGCRKYLRRSDKERLDGMQVYTEERNDSLDQTGQHSEWMAWSPLHDSGPAVIAVHTFGAYHLRGQWLVMRQLRARQAIRCNEWAERSSRIDHAWEGCCRCRLTGAVA
jgi:hypothetical protein